MYTALWAGCFITFFIFLLRPFGTQVPAGREVAFLGVCALFGLVTALTTVLVHGFCLLLPGVFDDEKWRLWKEIVFNLCFIGCIGLGNLLLTHFLWETPLNAATFWKWQGLTFAVGLFPTLLGAFIGQIKLQKKYTEEAARLSQQVHPPAPVSHASVVLAGDNQNETLRLDAAQILYLSAADNYVQVYYLENDALKSRILRGTMKKMEDALSAFPRFFRCHRTYIVNLDQVSRVSGNAQGYRLHLDGVEASVPVSRNLNETVREKLT